MASQRVADPDGGSIGACPDASVLIALAAGRLQATERQVATSHLDDCPVCAAAVAEAARASDDTEHGVASEVPGSTPDRAILARGASLGRFLVLEPLGEGGLGVVYEAYDPELDRRLAVKVLKDRVVGDQDEEAVRRFVTHEARALAKVAHPNVVTVFDIAASDGRVFIAMELVRGKTLRSWLEHDQPSWPEIAAVFIEAGRGLAAVHAAGLVHRDFKPGNVLVDEQGNARVLDFGLAAAAVEIQRAAGHDRDPEAAALVGTVAYMAPEQLRGDESGPRADQFSLCVALYEAAYGQRPFPSRDPKRRLAAIEAGPQFPARGSIPPWLAPVLRRGLAPRPEDRYPSVDVLLAELGRERGRVRRLAWAVALGMAGTAVVAGFAYRQSRTEAVAVDQIQAQVGRARAAAARGVYVYPPPEEPTATTAYREVLALEALDTARAREAAATLRFEFSQALTRIAARVWELEDGAFLASEYYAQALLFAPDIEFAQQRALLTPSQLSALSRQAATNGFSEAELLSAQPMAVLAVDDPEERRVQWARLQQRQPPPPRRVLAGLEAALGDVAVLPAERPRSPGVVADANRVVEAPVEAVDSVGAGGEAKQVTRRADKAAADASVRQGRTALKAGDLDGARQRFHRALEANPRSHRALAGLASVAFERGAYEETARYATRAVALRPKAAGYRVTLADAYFRLSRYSEALEHYRRAEQLGDPRAAKRIESLERKLGR